MECRGYVLFHGCCGIAVYECHVLNHRIPVQKDSHVHSLSNPCLGAYKYALGTEHSLGEIKSPNSLFGGICSCFGFDIYFRVLLMCVRNMAPSQTRFYLFSAWWEWGH